MQERYIVNGVTTSNANLTPLFLGHIFSEAFNNTGIIQVSIRVFPNSALEKILTILPNDPCSILTSQSSPILRFVEDMHRANLETGGFAQCYSTIEELSSGLKGFCGIEDVLMIDQLRELYMYLRMAL